MKNLALDMKHRHAAKASCYAKIAAEYYDSRKHPTCDNFRSASTLYIRRALERIDFKGAVVDVGAGRSLAAEILIQNDQVLNDLILLDSSVEMLLHSSQFMRAGVRAIVGDACALPFSSESIFLMISSLGDPYNVQSFWSEVARCLRPGGACLFTTPSHEWATTFRNSSDCEQQGLAFFELVDGDLVYVPSIIHSKHDQIAMIARTGLDIIASTEITADLVPRPHSKKIYSGEAIVSGYTVVKK